MTNTNPAADQAREQARRPDGKFGEQHKTDPGQVITPTYTAALTELNRQTDNNTWMDTITIYQDGQPIGQLHVESSEDAEPYDEALRAAGYGDATWLPSH